MKEHKEILVTLGLVIFLICLQTIPFYLKNISKSKNEKTTIEPAPVMRNEETDITPGAVIGGLLGGVIGSRKIEKPVNDPSELLDPLSALTDKDLFNVKYIFENYSARRRLEWINETTDIKYVIILNNSYSDYNTQKPCQDFTMEETTWYGKNTISKKACKASNGIWVNEKGQ